MDIALDIDKVNVDSVDVLASTIGRLSALTIKLEINNGFRLGLPIINKVLSKHQIPIPSNILGLFILSDLTLGYHDDYIYAGATPTFIGPSAKTSAEVPHTEPLEITLIKHMLEIEQ